MEKSPKSWMTTLLLTIFLGCWAKLYVNDLKGFFIRLFTSNGCMVLWVMDLVKLFNGTYVDGQGRLVSKD
jgi:hypothetical protein